MRTQHALLCSFVQRSSVSIAPSKYQRTLHVKVTVAVPHKYDYRSAAATLESIGFIKSEAFSSSNVTSHPLTLFQHSSMSIEVRRLPPPGTVSQAFMKIGLIKASSACVIERLDFASNNKGKRSNVLQSPGVPTVAASPKSASSAPLAEASLRLKEVVVPCGTRSSDHLNAVRSLLYSDHFNGQRVSGCIDMVRVPCKDGVYIRCTPANTCGLVFYVADIHQFINDCSPHFRVEHIGLRGGDLASQGLSQFPPDQYLRIDPSTTFGLEIRITNNLSDICSYYHEGAQALMEGTLPEIQSARVMGGSCDVLEDKYGYAGDCWSEIRAVARRKMNHSLHAIDSSQMSDTIETVHKRTTRTSKLPSIVE